MQDLTITQAPHKANSHSCRCGEDASDSYPELDARNIPSAIRHPAIFGVLDSLLLGSGFVLIAPHKPVPLLSQVEKKFPGLFEVSFINETPENFRVQFIRKI
jgi:uncharacterized protein (DUF2249 family)